MAAYETFASSLDRVLENNMLPGIEGKPVRFMALLLRRQHANAADEWTPNPIVSEQMLLGMTRPEHFGKIGLYPMFQQLPDEEKSNYRAAVELAYPVLLDKTTSVRDTIQPLAVAADYTATFLDSTSPEDSALHVAKFEKDNETALMNGLLFARDALAYVASPHFHSRDAPAYYTAGMKNDEALGTIEHSLAFSVTPELGMYFNGSENPEYLKHYRGHLIQGYRTACEVLAQMESAAGNHTSAIAEQRGVIEKYATTLLHIGDLLAKRND